MSNVKEILIKFNVPETLINQLNEGELIDLMQWCEASKTYYDGEALLMSDLSFDDLQEDLISIGNEDLTNFIQSSIYRNGKLEQEHYTQEMISLFKIKWENRLSGNKILDWFKDFDLNVSKLMYSPKFDGCSLKITWVDNSIQSIITRGGIDVTNHFNIMPSILSTNVYNKHIICGELICPDSVFESKYYTEVGGKYKNPRNFVGGLVKKNSIDIDIVKDLKFIPCTDGINPIGNIWNELTIDILQNLEKTIATYKSKEFDYMCDGVVIGYSESTNERRIKDNYPLNMVAVKFPATRVKTTVIGFDWTQKKSGKLTPRLLLNPVRLDGVTVRHANGYNIEKVIDNGIGVGSVVEIAKTGDIIPIVVKVIQRTKNIQYPNIEYKRAGKHLIAIDKEKSRRFKFVSGLKLLQIQGIGDILADEIGSCVDYDIIELFNTAHKADILCKLGNGANWRNFQEFYNIKTICVDDLINIMQFDNVGKKTATKIANILLKQSNDISNISSDIINYVLKGNGRILINENIKKLSSFGIRVIKPIEINEDTITFEMSNSPNGMTKDKFVELFKQKYPNAIHTTLSKSTKMLIVDSLSSNTSKILKARKYNIQILTYEDALK